MYKDWLCHYYLLESSFLVIISMFLTNFVKIVKDAFDNLMYLCFEINIFPGILNCLYFLNNKLKHQ